MRSAPSTRGTSSAGRGWVAARIRSRASSSDNMAGHFGQAMLKRESENQRLSAGGDHEGLLERGHTFPHFIERGHAQGFHPLARGNLADFHGAAPGDDDL